MKSIIFLILASLFIAEGLRKHGITRRLALKTLVAAGGKVSLILLGIMVIAGLFSMWVENTATAAVLIPVALTVVSIHCRPRFSAVVMITFLAPPVEAETEITGPLVLNLWVSSSSTVRSPLSSTR